MFRAQREAVRIFEEIFEPTGPILEIGSYLHLGYDHFTNLRGFFADCEYVGCDIREGPGVDVLSDAEQLGFDDATFETVLILEVLEHLQHPGAAVAEIHRVLTDDGLIVLSVPFNFRLHAFPTDYWRFTASGIHALLDNFPAKCVFALGPAVKPSFVFAVAAKRRTDRFDAQAPAFRVAIERAFSSRRSRVQGHASVVKAIGRDLLGWMLGRARVGVAFFDGNTPGGYIPSMSPATSAEASEAGAATRARAEAVR